jgi:EmrB/QacA subfamily drug resistance transporter
MALDDVVVLIDSTRDSRHRVSWLEMSVGDGGGAEQGHQLGDGPRRPNLLLLILCSAQLVLAVDVTVVNVANASIERALGFNSGNLQWTVTAYSLTFGGFLLLGGRMSDLFGRRRLFIMGISGFAITSLCAGSSQNTTELIASRAAQGFCAAVISPVVLSLLAATFPDGRPRQRAYGLWATAGSLGGLVGFLFGGLITSFLGWRWIFFVNGPIAVIAITGAVFVLPRIEQRGPRRRLDIPGAVSVTLGLALVIYGLGEAQSTSWTSMPTIVSLCCAPLLLITFFVIEHRSPEPLLPLALLRRRAAVGNLLSVFQQSIGASTAFLAPLYMQQVWGFSAGRAGASTLPLPIGFGIGARVSSRLVSRYGGRRLVLVGFSLVAIGCLLLARAPSQQSYFATFMPALLIRSFGQGMLIVPIVLSVTSGIRKDDQGIAAGLYNMSQQLGGALGLATVATIASAAATGVGGGVLGEAHGIRIGFLVALGLALVGGVIAMVWLQTPDQNAVIVEVAAGADSPHSIDDESPPLPLDLATPTASAISDTTDTSA